MVCLQWKSEILVHQQGNGFVHLLHKMVCSQGKLKLGCVIWSGNKGMKRDREPGGSFRGYFEALNELLSS